MNTMEVKYYCLLKNNRPNYAMDMYEESALEQF